MRPKKKADNRGKLRLWRLPRLDNLELFHGVNMTHDYPPHVHQEYSVLLVLKGAEKHIGRGRTYTATAGDLVLTNPYEAHSSRSIRTEYRIIRISRNLLTRIGAEVVGRQPRTLRFFQPVLKDPLSFQLLLNLHLKLEEKVSPLEQESAFISAIGFLLIRQNKNYEALHATRTEHYHVRQIQDYLKCHYAENISLAQLTSLTSLSPFYLLRVFHSQVGFPPHEYQTQLRIARARKLIRNGNSISDAALETGFFDQSHLSRNFKRIVGMTPGQYLSQSKIVQDSAN